MRTAILVFLATATLGGLPAAQAADLDYGVLRGPDYEPEGPLGLIDWSGVYVGGHGGYTATALGQRDVLQSTLADHFRRRDIESEFTVSQMIALPGTNVSGGSFGAFAGFNVQIDDTVFGIEADYTRFNKSRSSFAEIGRIMTTSTGIQEVVDLTGRSSTTIEDYGTVRGRVGYALGNFLPFVTGGLAVGRVSINDSVSVVNYGYDAKTYTANQALTSGSPLYVNNHGYQTFNQNYPGVGTTPAGKGDQTIPAPAVNLTAANRTKTVGGAALGFGLEYALTSNILLRGEYQYVLFQDFNGHKAELNTVRGGAAVKF